MRLIALETTEVEKDKTASCAKEIFRSNSIETQHKIKDFLMIFVKSPVEKKGQNPIKYCVPMSPLAGVTILWMTNVSEGVVKLHKIEREGYMSSCIRSVWGSFVKCFDDGNTDNSGYAMCLGGSLISGVGGGICFLAAKDDDTSTKAWLITAGVVAELVTCCLLSTCCYLFLRPNDENFSSPSDAPSPEHVARTNIFINQTNWYHNQRNQAWTQQSQQQHATWQRDFQRAITYR
jgi:hypothetical protein